MAAASWDRGAMLRAVRDGRTDLVFDLVPLQPEDESDGVPLIKWCAYYGDVSAVRYLLTAGNALEDLGPNLDLNGAAFHGHWRLAQYLLDRGASANAALPDTGERPLHAATCSGRAAFDPVVQVLLAHGADPNAPTIPGRETGSFMRDARTCGETPLHRAAAFAPEVTIRRLLDAGADVRARDAHGDSPLGWASRHHRPAYVLQLLCFDDHRIRPEAADRARFLQTQQLAPGGMEVTLLGTPHTSS